MTDGLKVHLHNYIIYLTDGISLMTLSSWEPILQPQDLFLFKAETW